jgi:hypothetical protein
MEDERMRRPQRKMRPRHVSCGKGEAIEDDGAIGTWVKEELQAMQDKFAEAIAREVRRPKR